MRRKERRGNERQDLRKETDARALQEDRRGGKGDEEGLTHHQRILRSHIR
jgi:hypothetical protein